ncbi:transposase [Rathayibacter sp. VKM Ac-2879]|uniref:integrase core domain-containing protein n=1 Tax=Rathayibacter sp. VKM Ac-2879 TaxID=2783832 RepID=UPI00188B7D1F|nr:transposase [Rathayibacter sp. VKM Ac-2879]
MLAVQSRRASFAGLGWVTALQADSYTDRIVELGAVPSTGTVGDSFDDGMAEAVNNLYKTELICQRGRWRTVEQVELATLEWVWWWNNERLHGDLDMRTPAEAETAYH